MRRRLLLLVVTIALGWIYLLAFVFATGIAAAQTTPKWWFGLWLFSKPSTSALIWLTLAHALAITAASLPFAWIIGRVYGRLGVPVALAITATICTFIAIPTMSQDFRTVGPLLQGIWLFEVALLLAALPVTVWVFQTWPSNNRSRGP